ncbi:MAG: aminobenzoate oxygenase [Pseudomonadota bacterium]
MDQLLAELNKRGVKLHVDEGRLEVNAPKGALTKELREALVANKKQLISLLSEHVLSASIDTISPDIHDETRSTGAEESDAASERQMAPSIAQPFEILETNLDLSYAWEYGSTRIKLRELYNKGQRAQWLADEALPWHLQPDLALPIGPDEMIPLRGSDIWNRMPSSQQEQCNFEITSWTLSQFLHGEQGALLASAQLVDSVTDLDSKLYGASQVADEARHVDVFSRYLREKVGLICSINPDLKTLLDLLLKDSRWDIKFLGLQIMVEGLALSSFAMLRHSARDPLLREITTYIMNDEARHMAYGIISLREYYEHQSDSFLREREDFVYEAARLMRNRFLFREVWEKLDLPVKQCMDIALHAPSQVMFRQLLFAKIVPTVKKLGLLSDRQRQRFSELGILQFENVSDPFSESEIGPI